MYVLVINCGSSTIKYQVVDSENYTVAARGNFQRIGEPGGELANHEEAMTAVLREIETAGINLTDIKAVGHRVVHGGAKFASSVLITDEVIKTISDLSFLAPMHNPANLTGIAACQRVMPNVKQVAVFDTAFHQTMPDFAYRYAVPTAWYKNLGIRKYGFHGTSHLYVSKRAAKLLGKSASKCNIISLHIGSGASACAISNGNSVDTSMGLTPLDGLTMGTRSGSLDPAIPFMVKEKLGLSDKAILEELNKRSGVYGITECYTDRRDVVSHKDDDDKCRLAIEMETYRVKKFIGMYMAALGTVDAIVFTAGVGENNPYLREMMTKRLEGFGIKIDDAKNAAALSYKGAGEQIISTEDSKIKVMVIPTDEERVIVEDAAAIIDGTYNPNHLEMKYNFAE